MPKSEVTEKLFDHVQKLTDAVIAISSTNNGILLLIIKFREILVLCGTKPEASDTRWPSDIFSLESLEPDGFLQESYVLDHANKQLPILLDSLLDIAPRSSVSLLTTFHSLASVAVKRPYKVPAIRERLARTYEAIKNDPALNDAKRTTLKYTLQTCLQFIAKYAIKIKPEPIKSKSHSERDRKRRKISSADPNLDSFTPPPQQQQPPLALAAGATQTVPSPLLQRIDVVANLVVDSLLQNTPMLPAVNSPLSAEVAVHMQGLFNLLVQTMPLAGGYPAAPTLSAGATAVVPMTIDQPHPAQPVIVATPSTKMEPKEVALTKEQAEDIQRQAFSRIIHADIGVQTSGAVKMRMFVLSRLACILASNSNANALRKELTNYILASFPKRHPLATTWFHHEFFASKLGGNSATYAQVLDAFLGDLITNDGTSSRHSEIPNFVAALPELTLFTFQFIRQLCEDAGKVGVGIAILTKLVLKRPKYAHVALRDLLSYTAHTDSDIRSPVIRTVSTQLHDDPLLAPDIESYALNSLMELSKQTIPEEQELTPELENEISKTLYLYMTLCAKKHKLLSGLVEMYVAAASVVVKKVVHQQMVGLIRAIGMASADLLEIITNMPKGAEAFVLQTLHILTESHTPSKQLITAVEALYARQSQDARFLIPVLRGLGKDKVVTLLPKLITLRHDGVLDVVKRLVEVDPPVMTAVELIVTLHVIPDNAAPIRKVIEAIQICMESAEIFGRTVWANALQQLVGISPLPPLLMRTLMQSLGKYPELKDFGVDLLAGLITKQIWKSDILWQGFIKCCEMTTPECLSVVLKLPPDQLKEILAAIPSLEKHRQHHIRHRDYNRRDSSSRMKN